MLPWQILTVKSRTMEMKHKRGSTPLKLSILKYMTANLVSFVLAGYVSGQVKAQAADPNLSLGTKEFLKVPNSSGKLLEEMTPKMLAKYWERPRSR
jgi:hypothetical protein